MGFCQAGGGAGGSGGGGGDGNWCRGFWHAGVARGTCADWCMGFCQAGGGTDGALGRARGGDRPLPGREGTGHGMAADAVLRRGDAAGRAGRRHQFGRVAIQAGDEGGRQMALVALRGDVDAGAAQHGETVAIAGAGLGAVVAVDGAGGAQVGEAVGGAAAGGAAAVRSLPAVGLAPGRLSRGLTRGAAELAADGARLAGAARAGAGAAARGEVEAGVAARIAVAQRAVAPTGS